MSTPSRNPDASPDAEASAVAASPSGAATAAARRQPLAARQVAWQVLLAVAAGAYVDAALERQLQRSGLEPADRALATELACGAIRQRALLDAWLDTLGRQPASRQPPRLRWLLHLGLYQLLFCQRVPAAAAVSTSVELAKAAGLGRLAPVVNAQLRASLRRREGLAAAGEPWRGLELPAAKADPATWLALRHSLPPWLSALLLEWLPPQRAEACALACNRPPPLDLRVNPLRASREAVLAALQAAGVAAAALPDLPCGIEIQGRCGDPRRLPGFNQGHWCVQDRAAQRIAPLLAPEAGTWLLDACAAPGGKSTHLAELIGDRGTIWAVDRSEARLERLRRNAARLGIGCIRTLAAEAQSLAALRPEWRGRFAGILVDAPCSGLGTLARHADARWRIMPAAIDELALLQRQLLEAVLPLLAPGGRLVYATCTLHPAENGALIAAFVADHPELELLHASQSWPGDAGGGDGFYAASLQLRAGLRAGAGPPPEAAA